MKNDFFRFSVWLVATAIGSSIVLGQEWTRFRGPNGTGMSDAKTIPTQWSERDFNWKVALPGTGHSSPVLWGEKIFLTSTAEDRGKILVLCVDSADGKILWQREFPFRPFEKHKFNSFASASPAVDSERVYICWSVPERYTLTAFDHSGKTVWERDLGPFKSQHGSGASPIVHGDTVVLGNEQDGQSFLISVEARTGQTRWQTSRRSVVAAYGTPCVYQPQGSRPQLIFNSQAHGISAVDAETGEPAWEYAKAFDKRSVSSPVVAGGLIFGSCGSGGGGMYVVAVRPADVATGQPAELAYELRRSAPYVPTALAVGELIFFWSDGGMVSCMHAASGILNWQERAGGNFFGSPVCVDGRIFCVSTAGEVVVIEASDKFKVLARNALDEPTHATPAIAGGRMYLRTLGHLISVGGKADAMASGQ